MRVMPDWLSTAIFYQVYPQSFCDSNGDGIGDINGITSKLDYIRETGFNALWINPCYVSPFRDAGYDVQNYRKVAPRYGTNADLERLFEEAHKRGMHVLLDLVPGHTSDQHRWFRKSCSTEPNSYSDRYIWSRSVWDRPEGYNWVSGNADRDGAYMLNFFLSQPALNYGFSRVSDPSWQIHYRDKRVRGSLYELKDIMAFWLDKGADGFRVDMADSLVKDDPDKSATCWIWRKIRAYLNKHYPQAAIISEWCNAPLAINAAGFHGDFILHHDKKMTDYAFYRKGEDGASRAYFCKTAHVPANDMLTPYMRDLRLTRGGGYLCPISGNHDMVRLSSFLDERERKLAFTFLLTQPGLPFVYYGDEIGMRYLPQPSKEGGYQRTGSRTPMQWDRNAPNLGFSTAEREKLYLDVDRSADAPCVAQQMEDEDSLWSTVRALNHLRMTRPDLQADGELRIEECTQHGTLCYQRGENTYVIINPTDTVQDCRTKVGRILFAIGGATRRPTVTYLEPQTAIIFEKEDYKEEV